MAMLVNDITIAGWFSSLYFLYFLYLYIAITLSILCYECSIKATFYGFIICHLLLVVIIAIDRHHWDA